jgi:hypothetical protein
MDEFNYKALLIAGNLARYKGGAFMIMLDKWKSFLGGHHFINLPSCCTPFEADQKRMVFNGKHQFVYVVRIGRGGDLLPSNFESQLKMDHLPPRINSLRRQQQKFRRGPGLAIAHVHVDLFVDGTEDSLPETAPSKSLAPQMGLSDADATTKIVGDEIGVGRQMYPILAGIYGDEFDPVDHKTLNSVRLMLSEIVHLLDASREGLKVKGFGGHDVMFVRVPCSASDKSFNNTKSWVDQALKYNGSPHPMTFESACRVSNHLCRFYKDAFVAAMEKQGMPIAQPMSTVEYTAMMSALNITGKKERVLGKFMRQHLGPAFCPTQRSVSILAQGHTKVYTGSMPWIYEGKEREETVEWTEKDLHTEIEVQLLRYLKSRGIGDTAFQFGAVITAEVSQGQE